MNIADIVLQDISHTHTQNDKHCMIPLNRGTYNSQIHREKKNGAG